MSNHRASPSKSIQTQNSGNVSWPSPAKDKQQSQRMRDQDQEESTKEKSPVTAKNARNFWQQKTSQPRNTTSWKKPGISNGNSPDSSASIGTPGTNISKGYGGSNNVKSPSSPSRSYISGSSYSDYSQSSKTFKAMAQKSGARVYSNVQTPPAVVENEDEEDYGESSGSGEDQRYNPQHHHQRFSQGARSHRGNNLNASGQGGQEMNGYKNRQAKEIQQEDPHESFHSEQHSQHFQEEYSFHSHKDSSPLSQHKSPLSVNPSKPQTHQSLPQSQSQSQSKTRHQNQPTTDDGTLGEMQIKLDIALAKILTEEMKRADVQSQLLALQQSSQSQIASLQSKIRSMQQREEEWKDDREVQKEEVKELYLEIERLHESHRAERSVVEGRRVEIEGDVNNLRKEIKDMKQDKANMELKMNEIAHNMNDGDEFQRMKAETAKKEEALKHTRDELKAVKEDVGAITRDFKELVDETERLEIELEAVTEDRDELLRRSIVYQNQSPGRAKERKHSSLSESSQVNYEEKQLQDEIERLRDALNEQEIQGKMKDARIQDLEQTVENPKDLLNLDLSAIDVENTSFAVERDEAKKYLEEISKEMQQECDALRSELEVVQKSLVAVHDERDQLKDCLADAIQELEQCEKLKAGENDAFAQELIQIVKEKDGEIDVLADQLAAEVDRRNPQPMTNVSGEQSFHEELNNVVQWLDSSTRINGSPSIEMMMLRDGNDNVTLTPEDDAVVQALYRQMKDVHFKLLEMEAHLESAKKFESFDSDTAYETSTEASFERGETFTDNMNNKRRMELVSTKEANNVVKNLRAHLKKTRDEIQLREETNGELRKSLSEAANLIKPLKEHVTRIESERVHLQSELAISTIRIMKLESGTSSATRTEEERLSLQSELASSTKRILQLENELDAGRSSGTKMPNKLTRSSDQDGNFVEVTALDLQEKDEEILELKVAVNRLRDELNETGSNRNAATVSPIDSFDEMPTPTKSNRGKDRSRFTRSAQSTNEEDDTNSRMISSKLDSLTSELKKRISAEETLKSILQDSSIRLTKLSAQATNLAEEKHDGENRIKQLEKEKMLLQQQLDSSKTSGESDSNNAESKALSKQVQDRNDRISIEVSEVKSELKAKNKEIKKLKRSLNEAVGMLNSLRNVVETSEKQRKKLKRHLRTMYAKNDASLKSDGTSVTPESSQVKELKGFAPQPSEEFTHVPDPDQMENQTTILSLRSHIVEMEHEIKILEERLDEVEVSNPRGESIGIDYGGEPESSKIQKLREELAEAQSAYEVTKTMLGEVSDINKEMLNDLKQTEDEAAGTLDELNTLQRKYERARDEIDDAKYVAMFALKKLEGSENEDQKVYGDLEKLPLADCINRLERQINALVGSVSNDW